MCMTFRLSVEYDIGFRTKFLCDGQGSVKRAFLYGTGLDWAILLIIYGLLVIWKVLKRYRSDEVKECSH